MYYFNSNLIARLPYLMGKNKTELYSMLGTRSSTFNKWMRGDIPVETLVRISNILRISVADFLVITEKPEELGRKTDYVFPADRWQPVEWCPENIATVFGPNSLTGVSKKEAADKLGLASYQAFDYWVASPSAVRMPDLLRMMNTFQLDATLFFRDSNKPIRLPLWKAAGEHLAEIANARMENSRAMERKVLDKDRDIRNLVAQNERLQKENRQLQERVAALNGSSLFPEVLRDGKVSYVPRKPMHGYAFHSKLWESLPEMFEMQKQEFCEMVGIAKSAFTSSPNIKVDVLVKACNLLHVSVQHFFPPRSELEVVYDRPYYEISPRVFVPIESRMDNMKLLFGRYSVLDTDLKALGNQCGVKQRGFVSMAKGGDRSRVMTLGDVCTQFNIPPALFFKDDNRKKPPFAESRNEQLLINAMEMMREIAELRKDNRKLRERLKKENQE